MPISFSLKCLIIIAILTTTNSAVFGQKAQSVYGEIGGVAGIYSINYDTRFTENIDNDGLGGRLGVAFFEDIFIVPLQVNYLAGDNGHYIELGAGATLITGVIDFGNGTNGFKVAPTASIMYRSQPIDGGFTWRIGILTTGSILPFWGGISLGYAF